MTLVGPMMHEKRLVADNLRELRRTLMKVSHSNYLALASIERTKGSSEGQRSKGQSVTGSHTLASAVSIRCDFSSRISRWASFSSLLYLSISDINFRFLAKTSSASGWAASWFSTDSNFRCSDVISISWTRDNKAGNERGDVKNLVTKTCKICKLKVKE